jgi:hypothetical protein
MAQSLGELFVSLRAETGGFVSALSKAAYSAQQASKQISRDFGDLQRIASQTFGAFGDFNPAISKLTFVLQSAGGAAASMMKELRGVGGALGPIAALAAGAAAGLTTIGIAAIGLAAHTAESAAKMHELAQSTGVPISALSGLSFAAKAVGVDVETLATGLERMSKSAFAASVAPAGATNAYTRLGVSIRDTSGNLRPAQDIFADLADKFSKMPDGIEKTAAAMQIFGRGGAALIPVLNEGKARIADFLDYASRVGAILTGPAGEAAHEFEMNLAKVSIAVDGVENRLMVALLPALTNLVERLADTPGQMNALVDTAVTLAKALMNAADAAIFAGRTIAAFWEATGKGGWSKPWEAFSTDTWKKFADDVRAAKADMEKFDANNVPPAATLKPGDATDWMLRNMKGKGTGAPGAPGASGRPDVVSEMVSKLQAQAAAELELAAATEKSIAASTLAKAAAEAETKIAETRAHLLEQEKDLRAQLADAQRDEAAGVGSASVTGAGGPGVRAEKLKGEIAGVQRMLAELQKDTPQIKQLYAEIASGDFFAKTGTELNDFIVKTREEGNAAAAMAKAFAQGGDAVQKAFDAAKLAPFEEKLRTINELINREKAAGIPTGTVGTASLIGKLFPNQEDARDRIAAQLSEATQGVADTEAKKINEEIGKQTRALALEAQAYDLVGAASLKSAAAQREAAAQAAALRYSAEHPEATPTELGLVRQAENAKFDEQRTQTIAQEAAQFDLNASYAQELEKLQEIKALLASSGESTLAIDTKIYETRTAHLLDYQRQVFDAQNAELLGNAKIYEAGVQLTEEWDRAALSVGTMGEKFRALVNQIQIEGATFGAKIFETFQKGLDDVSGQIAKFVVTGRSSFRSLLEGITEELLKAQIQWGFSKIFQGFFGPPGARGGTATNNAPGGTPGTFAGPLGIGGSLGGIFGLGGKSGGGPGAGGPNGSSGSPFYVIMTDSSGNPFGAGNALPVGPDSSSGGGGGLFGSLDSGGGDTSTGDTSGGGGGGLGGFMSQISGVFSKVFSTISSVIGSIVSSIGSLVSTVGGGIASFFGGFLAGGGDATPGRAYVVGEKGPEIFMPGQAGHVIPSLRGFRAAGGSVLANSSYLVGENGPEAFMPDSAPAASSSRGAGGGGDFHLHLHGVQDADSLNRSKAQIYSDMQQQWAQAHYRNRG